MPTLEDLRIELLNNRTAQKEIQKEIAEKEKLLSGLEDKETLLLDDILEQEEAEGIENHSHLANEKILDDMLETIELDIDQTANGEIMH